MKSFNTRWITLGVLCLGALMIVLDTTIVNVALPSIKADLGFSDTGLVWVVNAYMITFAGFMLLGGRLGDLFGHRRMFLIGLTLFTIASFACGISHTQWMLIAARAVQGLGGAITNAVALSLILTLFTSDSDRARAMGFFGFVAAGGGAIGVFLGGLLTGSFDWHWVFFINVPIGIIVFLLSMWLLSHNKLENAPKHLDLWGATTVTAALMLAMYGIIGGNQVGWLSLQTLGLITGALILLISFVYIEKRTREPLMPLSIFGIQNVTPISFIGMLWSAGMFTWFFLSALYMQLVLGYAPLQIGLAFLPANLIMAVFSVWLSAKIIGRFGIQPPLTLGLLFIALGLVLFALAPSDGNLWLHIMPAMISLGLGCGMAFNPVLLAGTQHVPHNESGLASGVLNTAFMMGGSLGLAVLASVAAWRTSVLSATGATQIDALLGGYHAAFWVGALSALTAAAIAVFFVRVRKI
ncbi:MFS transporter [Patescibacteria group bacterium]|nr:MFS transporter [Patescibacteria group bacterium]